MWWIMEKNVNTELEQFGVNVSEGVIHLFSGGFLSLSKRSHPSGYVYNLLLIF